MLSLTPSRHQRLANAARERRLLFDVPLVFRGQARLTEQAAKHFAAAADHLFLRHQALLQQPQVHDGDDREHFWPNEIGHINWINSVFVGPQAGPARLADVSKESNRREQAAQVDDQGADHAANNRVLQQEGEQVQAPAKRLSGHFEHARQSDKGDAPVLQAHNVALAPAVHLEIFGARVRVNLRRSHNNDRRRLGHHDRRGSRRRHRTVSVRRGHRGRRRDRRRRSLVLHLRLRLHLRLHLRHPDVLFANVQGDTQWCLPLQKLVAN